MDAKTAIYRWGCYCSGAAWAGVLVETISRMDEPTGMGFFIAFLLWTLFSVSSWGGVGILIGLIAIDGLF